MAYMNQAKKAIIVAAVKKVLPKDWKVSFRVENYSTIVLTVRSAPFDIVEKFDHSSIKRSYPDGFRTIRINENCADTYTTDKVLTEQLKALCAALDTDNHDNSDIYTDYFDVGHYFTLQFGSWDKPFINK